MLDSDLAVLYGIETGQLNQAVQRNASRFPADFMFQLSPAEAADLARLRSQFVTSNVQIPAMAVISQGILKSQSVISNNRLKSQVATSKRGGRRQLPYAFTEQGVAMLSSVLRSERAVQVNIAIMRAFVKLRELLASNKDLAEKLDALERKYDRQFKVVFDAIRQLMQPPEPPKRRIGFAASETPEFDPAGAPALS